MYQGCHTADAPSPVGESECDVCEDCDQRQDNGDDGVALHLARDGCIHAVRGDDTVGVVEGRGELFLSHLVCEEALQCVVNLAFDLLVGLLAVVVHFIFSGDTHLGCTAELLNLGCLAKLLHGSCTNLLGSGRLVETDNIGTTTAEVYTVAEALGEDAYKSDDAEHTRNDVSGLAQLDEVDVGILEEVAGCRGVEGDVFVACQTAFEYQSRDKDGGEYRSDDTDNQHGCETFDGAATEEEQDDTGDQGGQLTVDDGRICILITVGDSQTQRLAAAKLLFDTLVDDDVGIDRHTHGEHQTGDTGEGEDCAERYQGAEEEEHVAKQRDVGCPTCTAIPNQHVQEHEQECQCERNHTAADGCATQGRAHNLLLNDAGGSAELTGLEHGGEVFGLFGGEAAGDLAATAADLVLYVRI